MKIPMYRWGAGDDIHGASFPYFLLDYSYFISSFPHPGENEKREKKITIHNKFFTMLEREFFFLSKSK